MNNMNEWLVFVVSFVSCVLCQAPGDGDPICVQEVVDGITSPFFPLHPTYTLPMSVLSWTPETTQVYCRETLQCGSKWTMTTTTHLKIIPT